jgi:1-acyl-sn-glycerol-3-phosphate acyltransferase
VIRFLFFIVFFVPWTLISFAILVLVSPPFFPKRRELQDWTIRTWNASVLKFMGLKIRVQGLENYDPTKACIIASNHQSLLDIPIAYAIFKGSIRMVAKIELFKVPVFGWGLWISDFIPIHRGERQSAQESLNLIRKRLEQNFQIWMAPEGTRSKDGTLGPFKSGAFRSAIDLKVPLIPFVIYNSGDVNPKGTFKIKAGSTLYVKVLPPVDTSKLQSSDYNKLRDQVREQMKVALAQSDS